MLKLLHPTQLLPAAGIFWNTFSPCFCSRHVFKHPLLQPRQCWLWMLPPGCTWISAHQTQRHIFPQCRAREKQKGERRHLFQEATYKINTELLAGEKKLPPGPISRSFILQEEDRERKEVAQGGDSGRSILVSSRTAGLRLLYHLGALTLWGAVSPPLTCTHQQTSLCKTPTGNPAPQRRYRESWLGRLNSLELLFERGRSGVGKHSFYYSG